MRRIQGLGVLPAIVLAMLASAPAAAQDAQYTTISKADLGGFLNAVARLGGGLETEETTYVKGGMMRTDVDKSSTIMDFENGVYTFIDHDAKTYSVVTLAQMVEMMNQAMAEAQAQSAQAQGQAQAQGDAPRITTGGDADATIHGDSGDVKLDFQLDVDRTNESQKVNGWQAKRAFLTLTTDARVQVEGETEEQEAGSLIVFIDTWNSTEVPAHEAMQRIAQNAAGKQYMGEARGGMGETMGAAFGGGPEMGAAMEKAGEEMSKIDGTAVKSTMYFVALAPQVQFDRELVLNPQKESAAKKIAGGALRGALGRFGGGNKQEETTEEAPTQKTMFSLATEIRDAKSTDLPASLFEPPAGYRQVEYGAR
jgi:hypothetical protein